MGDLQLKPGDAVGPYIFERAVGKGGMAWVLLARDGDGAPIALKVLRSNRPGTGLVRFKREFRALSRLRHENIVRVEDFGDVGGHPYFTMEYVDGRDLHQEIRSWKRLDKGERWRRSEEALADLARALGYIHRRGLVHRDLKPSNVLVNAHRRCKLTDFGIVKELQPSADAFVSQTLVGTWAYASPEQISGAPIDHRSDLYSLGVILYAMLTGRRPFVARDMAGYLAQHRDVEPRPPAELFPNVPAHLNDICLRLLRKAPRERFQAASDVLGRLSRTDPAHRGATGSSSWASPVIGRRFEVGLLHDAVARLTRRSGGVVLIEGAEGHGRTRMLETALEQARRIGIPAHIARLTPNQGAFRALIKVADDLERDLGADGPQQLRVAMRAFTDGGERLAGDLRYQLFDGIRGALQQLLELGPGILAFDDLHHAPAPVLQLLGYIARTCIARDGGPLLIVATVRADVPTPALQGFRDGTELGLAPLRVELGALSSTDVGELALHILQDAERAAAVSPRLMLETGGSPLLLVEALKTLRETRDDVDDGDEEDAATEVVPVDARVPPAIRQAVARRVRDVETGERMLLEALSLHGQELDLDVLLDAAARMAQSVPPDETSPRAAHADDSLLDFLDDLIDRDLVVERRIGLRSVVDFVQPRDGEVLRHDIPPGRKVGWHAVLARSLAAAAGGHPLAAESIGQHHRKAGEDGPAWWHLTRAARGLWFRSLVGEAEAVVETARKLDAVARDTLPRADYARGRVDLLQVRSAILFNRGRWLDARQALSALRGAALAVGDDGLAASAGLDLGTTLRRLGMEEEGEAMVDAVLSGARAREERGVIVDALHRLAVFSWEKGDLDSCEDYASQALRLAHGPEMRASRANIHNALATVHASRGQLAAATSGLAEAGEIHRELGNKRAEAVSLGNQAELRCLQGDLAGAIERAEEALGLSRAVLYREGEAFVLRVRGMANLEIGRKGRAAADFQASLDALLDIGGGGDTVATRYFLAWVYVDRGNLDGARLQVTEGLRTAEQSDPESYGPLLKALDARILALQGDDDGARQRVTELKRLLPLLPMPRRMQVLLELADLWLTLADIERTADAARKVAQTTASRGLRCWALRGWMTLAETSDNPDEAESARRSAANLARLIRADLPSAMGAVFESRPGIAGLLWSATI